MRCDPALNLPHLKHACPTTSIWTVDLAHLLRRFGVDVRFFTITLGANPEYAAESFYRRRPRLADDGARVDALWRRRARRAFNFAQKRPHAFVTPRQLPTDDGSSSSSWISAPSAERISKDESDDCASSRDGGDDAPPRESSEGGGQFDLVFGTGDARHRDRGGRRVL